MPTDFHHSTTSECPGTLPLLGTSEEHPRSCKPHPGTQGPSHTLARLSVLPAAAWSRTAKFEDIYFG